ncbi:hypothetical protein PHYPO_G00145880 [Pangasianodon hypophthalmus]|uniref:Uncharacterized protein n=1 Tax=Pangasianodon hypophthalmus TaxID=310915 RepID=A0A5N5K3A6_PANHP|nr:hypothetical protein PHYPO_G00145880 [Pangasianodon hypophthalmus]
MLAFPLLYSPLDFFFWTWDTSPERLDIWETSSDDLLHLLLSHRVKTSLWSSQSAAHTRWRGGSHGVFILKGPRPVCS